MIAPTEVQLRLLRLLDENNGLYDFDEQLEPYWDQSGGEPNKPDTIGECYELGWVDSETCNHSDIFYLTEEGRALARAREQRQ